VQGEGRQGIEGTGRLSSRCPSAVKLALLLLLSKRFFLTNFDVKVSIPLTFALDCLMPTTVQ